MCMCIYMFICMCICMCIYTCSIVSWKHTSLFGIHMSFKHISFCYTHLFLVSTSVLWYVHRPFRTCFNLLSHQGGTRTRTHAHAHTRTHIRIANFNIACCIMNGCLLTREVFLVCTSGARLQHSGVESGATGASALSTRALQ